jgi:hypothetical protein
MERREREPRRIAGEQGIDIVISGSVEEAEGGVRLTLSVFSRAEERVVLRERGTTDSALEIFNLTDTILLALLGGFTESPLAFGEVRFVNTGVDRDYVVRPAAQVIGVDVRRLDRVVAGTRHFEIADEPLGKTLFDETIDDTRRYSLELRLQEHSASVSYRKESGRRNEAVDSPVQPPRGSYAISDDGRLLETAFPLRALKGYLDEAAFYEAVFRIWEIDDRRTITTPRFPPAPY